MRAAVLRNKRLAVDDVPDPAPGPGQVLLETIACGICGSDLHFLQHGDRMLELARESGQPAPLFEADAGIVMGHEFSARVLELGPGATGVAPGDVVVALPAMLTEEGVTTIGYSPRFPGGYGERVVALAALCLKVPDGLDPRLAALTEPMAVGRHAAAKASVASGESAIVLGCGPIGLAIIAALALDGVEPIVAAEFSPKRRELAKRLGAHEAVDPNDEPAIDAWRRVASTRPPVIFEAVGVPGTLDLAMRAAQPGGRIIVAGACMEPDTVWPIIGLNKQLTVEFVLGYDQQEFTDTLAAIADGRLDVAPMITDEVGLGGVADAFEALARPDEQVKILVRPDLG